MSREEGNGRFLTTCARGRDRRRPAGVTSPLPKWPRPPHVSLPTEDTGGWWGCGTSSELWGRSSGRPPGGEVLGFTPLPPLPAPLGQVGETPSRMQISLSGHRSLAARASWQAGLLPLHFLANHDSDLPRGEEAALGESGRVPLPFHYSVPSAHFRNPSTHPGFPSRTPGNPETP